MLVGFDCGVLLLIIRLMCGGVFCVWVALTVFGLVLIVLFCMRRGVSFRGCWFCQYFVV